MTTPNEIYTHESARMSTLMRAFDDALNDGCGFGSHSVALVACVGFVRCLFLVREMYRTDIPESGKKRRWALQQYDILDEICERVDLERCVRELVESCGDRDSAAREMAMAFVEHIASNEWIVIDDKKNEPSIFTGGKDA